MPDRHEWLVSLSGIGDPNPREYLRTVVRVFPDYAGTVLWFIGGPLTYEEAGVTTDLAAAMESWEAGYYAALENLEWKSRELAAEHGREGLRLARSLSDELGRAFDVEVFGHDDEFGAGEHRIRIRSRREGSNPVAVAALTAIADDDEAREAESAGTGPWTVYAPMTGEGMTGIEPA